MKKKYNWISSICSILLLSVMFSCTGTSQNVKKSRIVEKGKASWYGKKFNGRKTASGEVFNSRKLTAAHKTLPFGTMVKVKNVSNNKTVVVKINDRGPHSKNRIIDLSEAAAAKIGIIRAGIADVTLEIVKK